MRETSDAAPGPSRAPVYVVIGGLGLALSLVFLAASVAQRGAPAPPIDRPGTLEAPRAVNVIMRDYTFVPSPVTLVRGETVTLDIVNGGLVPHELVLGDGQVQAAWESAEAAATPPAPFATASDVTAPAPDGGLRVLLGSGGQTQATFTVPLSGDLSLVCHLPGHAQRGMASTVTLLEQGARSPGTVTP